MGKLSRPGLPEPSVQGKKPTFRAVGNLLLSSSVLGDHFLRRRDPAGNCLPSARSFRGHSCSPCVWQRGLCCSPSFPSGQCPDLAHASLSWEMGARAPAHPSLAPLLAAAAAAATRQEKLAKQDWPD